MDTEVKNVMDTEVKDVRDTEAKVSARCCEQTRHNRRPGEWLEVYGGERREVEEKVEGGRVDISKRGMRDAR